MKNIYKIFTLIAVVALFTSCDEEVDKVIYNGLDTENRTLLSFPANSYNLPVEVGASGTVDVILYSSTKSSAERSFGIMVNPETTTALPDNYSIPSSVTIPADSYEAVITITGLDDDQLGNEVQTLNFSLTNVEDVDMDSNAVQINLFEVCPVPETFFTGMYLMEQVSPYIDGPTLSDGDIVEVMVDENDSSGLTRVFLTQHYPDYCGGYVPFTVNLVCNELKVPTQDSVCSCGNGADWFGTAANNDTYNVGDGDTEIFISFLDDVQGNCAPVETTRYKFTKQ